tara:strand:- start:582 stop:749 length:168 start_codon:yes stop_codon:yes gene_type:complete
MYKQNKLPEEIKNTLESINHCAYLIAQRDNLDVKFEKLGFLEDKGFYNYKNNKYK